MWCPGGPHPQALADIVDATDMEQFQITAITGKLVLISRESSDKEMRAKLQLFCQSYGPGGAAGIASRKVAHGFPKSRQARDMCGPWVVVT